MTRWYYSAGAARIVVLQVNSSRTRKSTGGRLGRSAMSAISAGHGSDATKAPTKHLAV